MQSASDNLSALSISIQTCIRCDEGERLREGSGVVIRPLTIDGLELRASVLLSGADLTSGVRPRAGLLECCGVCAGELNGVPEGEGGYTARFSAVRCSL